jgi:hypothetical protein
MTPDVGALCRAARNAPDDQPALVVAFVRGLLARGRIEAAALVARLEAAGIPEHRWSAAAAALQPTSVLVTARRRIRSAFLRRHHVAREFR